MKFKDIDPHVRRIALFTFSGNRISNLSKGSYEHRMIFCDEGRFLLEIDGQEYECPKNSLIYWKPGSWYRMTEITEPPCRMWSIFFDFDRQRDPSAVIPFSPPVAEYYNSSLEGGRVCFEDANIFNESFLYNDCAFLSPVLAEIYNEFIMKKLDFEKLIDTRFVTFLIGLRRRMSIGGISGISDSTPAGRDATVEKIISYIHANAAGSLNCEEVAAGTHYNQSYINRLMRKATGTTLHEYIQKIRIQKAVEMIESSEMPITEIAQILGFSDGSHFTKVFRQKTGFTPVMFRKAGTGETGGQR